MCCIAVLVPHGHGRRLPFVDDYMHLRTLTFSITTEWSRNSKALFPSCPAPQEAVLLAMFEIAIYMQPMRYICNCNIYTTNARSMCEQRCFFPRSHTCGACMPHTLLRYAVQLNFGYKLKHQVSAQHDKVHTNVQFARLLNPSYPPGIMHDRAHPGWFRHSIRW